MRDSNIQSRLRRRLLLFLPAAVTASFLAGQTRNQLPNIDETSEDKPDVRLPNGKRQVDEILKDDYEKNLKDARDLTGLAKSLEEDLEKNDAFVFSLSSLKKLDDMEKLTRRIRGRMKRF